MSKKNIAADDVYCITTMGLLWLASVIFFFTQRSSTNLYYNESFFLGLFDGSAVHIQHSFTSLNVFTFAVLKVFCARRFLAIGK